MTSSLPWRTAALRAGSPVISWRAKKPVPVTRTKARSDPNKARAAKRQAKRAPPPAVVLECGECGADVERHVFDDLCSDCHRERIADRTCDVCEDRLPPTLPGWASRCVSCSEPAEQIRLAVDLLSPAEFTGWVRSVLGLKDIHGLDSGRKLASEVVQLAESRYALP